MATVTRKRTHDLLDRVFEIVEHLGEYACLIAEVVFVTLRRPPNWKLIRDQMYQMGVLSVPVIVFTGLASGMVLAAETIFNLSDKGLASGTGILVAKAMVVDLGPVLSAYMVTGRVGAAMCAELGTMRVTEQIDALKSMAVNPIRHLVAPRFIAGIAMMPLLNVFSALTGVFGGYVVAVYLYRMPERDFLDPLPIHLRNYDLFTGEIKALAFGVLITTISCYLGMRTRGGAEGVGRNTTHSVVICYSMILLSNFFIALALNSAQDWFTQITGGWL